MCDAVGIAVVVGLVLIVGAIVTALVLVFGPAVKAKPEIAEGPGPRTYRLMLLTLILVASILLGAAGQLKGEVVTFLSSLAAFVLGGTQWRDRSHKPDGTGPTDGKNKPDGPDNAEGKGKPDEKDKPVDTESVSTDVSSEDSSKGTSGTPLGKPALKTSSTDVIEIDST